jgi:hypothetical protein
MIHLELRPAGDSTEPGLYTVDLLNGDYANIVNEVGAWALIVHPQNRTPQRRGLFGSAYDALTVLEAEVNARIVIDGASDRRVALDDALERRQQASVRDVERRSFRRVV